MTKAEQALLPDRYPNQDFFICDVLDAIPKDDMATMEHPIFSLSTKPNTHTITYQHNGVLVQVIPSTLGLATIHDKDVLLYCGSVLMDKLNKGEMPPKTIRVTAHDLLVSCNRTTNNLGYDRLKAGLDRLSGTRIKTNIETGGVRQIENFGLIDAYGIVEKSPTNNRMIAIQIKLSDWFYNAIVGKEMLTISRDYFRLRKPLERRVYEIARKHCGQQKKWAISLENLQKKCGSVGSIKEFRRMVKTLVEHDHLPDYHVVLADGKVTFTNRGSVAELVSLEHEFPQLRADTFERAKRAAPGYDVYYLEGEWRSFWVDSGKPQMKNPDAAFIGFCQRRYERRPNP